MNSQSKLRTLKGEVAIVTGASSGLGFATAKALAAEGVRLFCTARREDRLRALADEIAREGGECAFLAGDASDDTFASAVAQQTLQTFGRIDILVNNAGQGIYKKLTDTTADEFDSLVRANLRSTFLFTRAVVPQFTSQRSGTLIFISSVAGLAGAANEAVYSATKFAQVGFAQSLDEELRQHGVKVCVLCPGGMKTEFAIGHGRIAEDVAASTMMDPQETAEAVLFACKQPGNLRVPQIVVRHMGRPK